MKSLLRSLLIALIPACPLIFSSCETSKADTQATDEKPAGSHTSAGDEKPGASHTHAGEEKPTGSHTHAGDEKPVGSHTHTGDEKPGVPHTHPGDEKPATSHNHNSDEKPAGSHAHNRDEKPAASHNHKPDEKPAVSGENIVSHSFSVENLTCSDCNNILKTSLEGHDGIVSADVDYKIGPPGFNTIVKHHAHISKEDIVKFIIDAGYELAN